MSTQATFTFNHTPGLYLCKNLSCIDVYGQDAVQFLQSQLSQDLGTVISSKRAALAGYCTAQGRLLASMILCPAEVADRIRIIVRSDLVDGLVKRLRMFVLRSKVTLEPQTSLSVYGLMADTDENLPVQFPATVWDSAMLAGQQLWIHAPSAVSHMKRAWVVCAADDAPKLAGIEIRTDATNWDVADILAGLPWIQELTRDLFIPQTINLDLLGGISFTKGCYPGQEVVARAHYRSKVKRRMHLAMTTPALPQVQAGSDVHPVGHADEPCGRIIQVAHTEQASYLLFEAPDQQIAAGPLAIAQSDAAVLSLLELPYSTQTSE